MYQPGKRVTREELYEAVWSRTIKSLIEEWNTSYLQVGEACRRLQVPRPKPAYWQWLLRGRLVKRKPLRKPTKKLPKHWVLLSRVKSPREEAVAAARAEFDEAELQRRREAWRRQQELREREEERQRIEEKNLSRLVENSQAWLRARRLRRFIQACEAALEKMDSGLDCGGWQQNWLAWARGHAAKLDPMTNGFLESERQRLMKEDLGTILHFGLFGPG